jgi:phage terminase large subunit GpA-like protein
MANNTVDNRVKKARLDYIKYGGAKTAEEKKQQLLWSFFRKLKPPERIDLDDWMDKHFVLPSETSSEHGRWRTSRFPFLRKIAKKLSPSSKCREIGGCKGAQLGFTTIGLGWNLYISKICPGPTMYVQPTTSTIEEYSEQKLETTIKLCKEVADTFGDKKPISFTNKKLRKYYPGGYLALASANSAPTMRSKSTKYLQIDEEDACSQNVNNEGSAVYLAIRRTANFPDKKIFRLSTPIHKTTSSIIPFCESGTAERYLVPCPHCNPKADKYGTYAEIKWANIKYENNNPKTAKLVCEECGTLAEEHHKTWMLNNGFWYRYNPTPKHEYAEDEHRTELLLLLEKNGYNALDKESKIYLENSSIEDDEETKCTFFISSLYSPLGFYSWEEAVASWIEAISRKDKMLIRTFINTVLGEGYTEESVEGVDSKGLYERRELYSDDGSFDVPNDVLFITCGADVQKDRIEAQVIGTGFDNEEWVVDYKVFYGPTDILGDENLNYRGVKTSWGQFHEFLNTKYKHQCGLDMPIEMTLVDSKYRSPQVYTFCKGSADKMVFPVQGRNGWGKGLVYIPTKPNKFGVRVFEAMADEIKEQIYDQIKNNTVGPNYIHFPRAVSLPHNYFKGLVIEELRTKQQGFKTVRYWHCPTGGRNEPLDTYVYAKSALLVKKPSFTARREYLDNHTSLIYKKRNRVISEGIT